MDRGLKATGQKPLLGRGARVSIEVAIALGALLFLLPVVLIFITPFKPDSEIIQFSGLLPERWTWENYAQLLGNREEIPILRWLWNSVFISTAVTLLVLAVDSLAAYALARMRVPGGGVIFMAIILTMMIPGQVFLVPVYLELNWLGWLDTPLALIVPPAAGAFGVFLLRQFFLSIPRDLEDAAAIDGCGYFKTYLHVVLPLSKPALATLAILTYIGSWNDFIGPLVYLDSVDKYTLPVGIALFQTSYYAEYGLTLAASVICTLPVIVIFLFFQRQIIESITTSGMKE